MFTGSHLRVITDADDDIDADNAGRHSTTTRATYRQQVARCFDMWLVWTALKSDIATEAAAAAV